MENFVKNVLDNGGEIKPLIIDSKYTKGTGLFNPSILVDNDKIYVNVRHCQYTLYHSEFNKYEHPYGPLLYLNPENDITLTTTNFFGELNSDLSFKYYHPVDTSKLDVKPLWEFVGLEDARIIKWEDKFYLCGVRRDTTTNGQGRMELSELEFNEKYVKEISRQRIPAPGKNDSYCEKNWMPFLDKPYCFFKWSNPVEIVKYNPKEKTCETVILKDTPRLSWDQRGGGQVIKYKDGYLTLTHETYLYKSEVGRKNATYRHKLILWSNDFEPLKISQTFGFMGAKIEFACGLAQYKDSLLMTFGYQDNAAFVLKVPMNYLENFLNG